VIWSDRGGWRPEEEPLLLAQFGDDTTLDIIERSTVEPRVVITWVGWDRLPPSIYIVDFRQLTEYGTPVCREFMTVDAAKASEWAEFFPAEGASTTGTGTE
jgi:hypothetical protein